MTAALTPAERLLQSLGVTEPEEIDLEAIAWHLGVVKVKYARLDGCEARIVGVGDKAIITVDDRSIPQRSRFSVAHELGHWHFHRGRTLLCRCEDISEGGSANGLERTANKFAAELLLPSYLLLPMARRQKQLTLKALRETAARFRTSLSATAFRLVEAGQSPTVLICHNVNRRRWFVRSPDVPSRWYPRDDLDSETYAFGLLHGSDPEQPSPRKMPAQAWFDRGEAARYEVTEQSFRSGPGEIVTIVTIQDEGMLEEREVRWR